MTDAELSQHEARSAGYCIHASADIDRLIAEVRKARAAEEETTVFIQTDGGPGCAYCTAKVGAHRIVRPSGIRWQIACPECLARGPMEMSAAEALRSFRAGHGQRGDTPYNSWEVR